MAAATHGVGEIIAIEKGEYEDRRIIGIFRVIRPFNLGAVTRTYHETAPQSQLYPNDPDEKETSEDGFVQYMVRTGLLYEIPISDKIHVGCYGTFDASASIAESESRIPSSPEYADEWNLGAFAKCIVSAEPVPGIRGNDDTAFYGGHLVAESVAPQNLHLIAAAPRMRNSLQQLIDAVDSHGYLEEHPALFGARKALAQALEQHPPGPLNW